MPTPTGTIAPSQNKATLCGPAMSDAVAPPVPNRSKPLRKPTHSESTSKIKSGMGGFVFGLVVGGALFYFGSKVLGGAMMFLFCGLGLLISFGSKDEVSDCPFCGAPLHNLPKPDASGVPRPVQCRKCWEYS